MKIKVKLWRERTVKEDGIIEEDTKYETVEGDSVCEALVKAIKHNHGYIFTKWEKVEE